MDLHPDENPSFLNDYLIYLDLNRGRSPRTVAEYHQDICRFLRWFSAPRGTDPDTVEIVQMQADALRKVTVTTLYEYIRYLRDVRGNTPRSVARRMSAVRSLFRYLTRTKGILEQDPCQNLELPAADKPLPHFLTLRESERLLETADARPDSPETLRDYCILTLFLNCGFRLSELVGMNVGDVDFYERQVRVLGKGSKERLVYLNDACLSVLHEYMHSRENPPEEPKALFLSRNHRRISRRRVQQIVENALQAAGLSGKGLSTHKLRHTAATLMYRHGGTDTRTLRDIL
ncbi:MAG: recombinase XerC, partial [Ruminococcus sp.]|nr:recombinase XerC [Ruminococcus sp.]